MATVSLATMRGRARRRANQETLDQANAFITDAEIDENLNYHLEVIYSLLVEAREQNYFRTEGTYLTATQDLALPDFLQIISVDWIRGPGDYVSLSPFMEAERNLLRSVTGGNFNATPMYQLRPTGLRIYPIPTSATSFYVAYVPKFTRLVVDTDVFEGVAGFEDYAIAKTAAYMLAKDQDTESAAYHEQQAETIRQRIVTDAPQRNAGMPLRIQRNKRTAAIETANFSGSSFGGGGTPGASAYNGPPVLVADFVTTDNATQTLAQYLVPQPSGCRFSADIMAFCVTTGIAKAWSLQRRGLNITSLISGSEVPLQPVELIGTVVDPGWTCVTDTSSNNFRVRITGATGQKVFWRAYVETAVDVGIADVAVPGSPPTVVSITPDIGANTAGTAITITGTNFTGATGATVGGAAVTAFVVLNSTTATAVLPVTTAGILAVAVTNASGTGSTPGLFSSLEVASLPFTLHYAGAGVTTALGFVTAVLDQGVNAHDLTAAGAVSPTRNATDAAYNNKPTFGFSDVSSRLVSAAYAVTQPITRFVVGNTSGGGGGLPQYLCDGLSGYLGISGSTTTGGEAYASVSFTFATSVASPQVICVAYNGASSVLSISAQTEATGNVGTSIPGGITIGSNAGGSYGCMGKVALVLQISGTLTLAQRNVNKLTLGAYYGKSIAA